MVLAIVFILNVVHYGLCEMVNTLYKIQDSENHTLLSGTYRIYLNERRPRISAVVGTN